MRQHRPSAGDRAPAHNGGFTLIEMLVVIGIIGILASMILPAMFAVSQEAKITRATMLLKRIEVALDLYSKSYVHYPPDYIPQTYGGTDTLIYDLGGAREGSGPSSTLRKVKLANHVYPPEALYYFLCHRYISAEYPMLQLQSRSESLDVNGNGLPEIVDSWGRPYLYNRPAFPSCNNDYFNLTAITLGGTPQAVLGDPAHNTSTYDLYSVGPDGQTGSNDLPEYQHTKAGDTSFLEFIKKAMDASSDGTGEDDIRNWR